MENSKVNIILLILKQKIPNNKFSELKIILEKADDLILDNFRWIKLHHPIFILIMSLWFGTIGVDRFILGDLHLGVLKILLWLPILLSPIHLVTWLLIIWGIIILIDACLCYNKAKKINYRTLIRELPIYTKYKAEKFL